jgi:DNA-binding transcriptional regulator YiaG
MFRTLVEAIGLAGTLFAGFWAVVTYRQSLKLQRARWVKELYEKFYEHSELKKVRNLLDSNDIQQIRSMVEKEDPAFTDYLNFFEFLGYLWESKQVSEQEILHRQPCKGI